MLLLSLQKLDQAVKGHPDSISHSVQGSTLPFPGGPLWGTPPQPDSLSEQNALLKCWEHMFQFPTFDLCSLYPHCVIRAH